MVRSSDHHARLIRITSRMGIWGLVAALVPPLAEALGGPFWLATLTPLVATGLATSGLGTVLAAGLVLSALPARRGPLFVAALAGIPLGVVLMAGGAAVLAPLSGFADLVDSAGVIVLAAGAVVVVSLVIGFLFGGRHGS